MNRRVARIVIPLIVIAIAAMIVLVTIFSPTRNQTQPQDGVDEQAAVTQTESDPAAEEPQTADGAVNDDPAAVADADAADAADEDPDAADAAADQPEASEDAPPPFDLSSLYAAAPVIEMDDADEAAQPEGDAAAPATLGSLDPREAPMLIEFDQRGAGISRITLSEVWETALARHRAEDHYNALEKGESPDQAPPLPDPSLRYVLIQATPYAPNSTSTIPVLGVRAVIIEGQRVELHAADHWAEIEPGHFQSTIRGEADEPIVTITRRFWIGDTGDITLEQHVQNHTDHSLDIRWSQWGPGDLRPDRARYMDRRRFRFGPLVQISADPPRSVVLPNENDLLFERSSVIKRVRSAAELADPEAAQQQMRLWPNETSIEENYDICWFASSNRYFTLAIHPLLDQPDVQRRTISHIIDSVYILSAHAQNPDLKDEHADVFTVLESPERRLEPGATETFSLGVYAGPLDPDVLAEQEPYSSLGMSGLILYQMSSWCALCTFQWLAKLLLAFLGFLKTYVVFDWGLAIIGLVLVVRALLHPISRKGQINMHRFQKRMTKIKPELDKLKEKYASDPKRMQQEQMRLFREHGVNPLHMLGCLPMLLQAPIWIALYAGLYFAYELRHEPAFFGFFQAFGNWSFLADLSSADHFFWQFDAPYHLFWWNITGINLLPILMGVMFYVQQKYLSPSTAATLSKEQAQQQKIMRFMMVVMFPLMLYSAPSGLTLYILTSSTIGILEGRWIRAHIDELDKEPSDPAVLRKKQRKGKPRDAMGKAYADALERMKKKRQGPPKRYKRRK